MNNRHLSFKIVHFLIGFLLTITLTGCSAPSLRVGTVSGPETELMKYVKTVALKDYKLRIKIIEFDDGTLLNKALNEGGLDANIFQHQPYLNETLKYNKYRLKAIGKTFMYPMGIYSCQLTHLQDIPKRSIMGIPNDPTNQSRALRLLEKAGLIKLDIDAQSLVTPKSVRYNPKALQFRSMDASQLARALHKNVDVAVMNMNYAISEGLYPHEHALFTESIDISYTNVVVVREKDKDRESLKQLVAAYQDEEVLAYANALFKGQIFPGYHGGEGGIRTRGRF